MPLLCSISTYGADVYFLPNDKDKRTKSPHVLKILISVLIFGNLLEI